MGSPRMMFGDLWFASVCTSIKPEDVSVYFTKLAETLSGFYTATSISTAEVNDRFSWFLSEQNSEKPFAEYSFHVGTSDEADHWKTIVYRTQIPHIESGFSPDQRKTAPVNPKLIYRLIEKQVAAIAIYKDAGQVKGSVLTQVFRSNAGMTIVGEVTGVYLISKIDSISSLHKNWGRNFFQNSYQFPEFCDRIEFQLRALSGERIITIPFDRIRPLRQFVAKCDSLLQASMTKSQLEKTLASIGVSMDEWFSAKI